jgi:hypothetical protein
MRAGVSFLGTTAFLKCGHGGHTRRGTFRATQQVGKYVSNRGSDSHNQGAHECVPREQ